MIFLALKDTASLAEAVAFRTELLGVVSGAVDFLVGTFAAVSRIETLSALVALEASLVPWLEIEI